MWRRYESPVFPLIFKDDGRTVFRVLPSKRPTDGQLRFERCKKGLFPLQVLQKINQYQKVKLVQRVKKNVIS